MKTLTVRLPEPLVADIEAASRVRKISKSDVPMSLADACLVRMTETISEPIIMTTDGNFRIYRRHSRQIVPRASP